MHSPSALAPPAWQRARHINTLRLPLTPNYPLASSQVRPRRQRKGGTQNGRHAQQCREALGATAQRKHGRAAQRPTPVTRAGATPYLNPPPNARRLAWSSEMLCSPHQG